MAFSPCGSKVWTWLGVAAAGIVGAAIALAACDGGSGLETLCNPGDNIFCRCAGGTASCRGSLL